jgi:4-alpha-glucanotransferase
VVKTDPRAWGVMTRFTAADGTRRRVSAEAVRAVLSALGATGPAPDGEGCPLVLVAGHAREAAPDTVVELEEGGSRRCDGCLPADLPLGYHRMTGGGPPRPLIVTPPRCHLPATRGFGFAVQLYAARSAASWGIGDLADLAALGRWARGLGASALLVSPLHAALLLPPVEASPYLPVSRVFRNPLHLRPDAIPGATGLEDLAARARALNSRREIDRDAAARLKREALERLFRRPAAPSAGERALANRPLLRDFALFCALAERHGPDWRRWPPPLAHREPEALRRAGRELSARVRFHAWVQVELDRQMETACAELPPIQDLAVGVHPGGADAWLWQDLFAPGVSVGVPPDTYNPQGQDWSLPAFDPWKLRAAGYAPFIETVRAGLRHASGLRLDHVLGLERLWWIPAGGGPRDGCYVRYPLDDLLGIVALESVRHGATVVGEDLGTVPAGLRSRIRERGLLGYVLLIFEERPPRRWPRQAVAAVTTHDLPTIAGLWDGSDLETRRRLGLPADPEAARGLAEHAGLGGSSAVGSLEEAIVEAHRRVGDSSCLLVTAALEDIAAVRERPNQPGLAGPPSWSLGLPLPLEELVRSPLAERVARALGRSS